MTTAEVLPVDLARVALFAGLPDDELAALAAVATRRSLPDGGVLFRRGEPARHLHVVVAGGIVLRADGNGRSVIVDTLGPGDVVGWSAMREDAVTLSTGRGVGPTELLSIPIDPIIDLASGGSAQARTLVRRIVGIAARNLEASWHQLLQVDTDQVITGG